MLFFALNVWQKPYGKMIGVPFYHRVVPPQPAACTKRGNFFLELGEAVKNRSTAEVSHALANTLTSAVLEVVKPTVGT